jgi:hypothetical protein
VPQRGEIKGRFVHVFTKQSKLSEVARAGSFHGKYWVREWLNGEIYKPSISSHFTFGEFRSSDKLNVVRTTNVQSPLIFCVWSGDSVLQWSDLAGSQPATACVRFSPAAVRSEYSNPTTTKYQIPQRIHEKCLFSCHLTPLHNNGSLRMDCSTQLLQQITTT